MKTQKPRAYVADPAKELPIRISTVAGTFALALPTAKALLKDLSAAVKTVDEYFRCVHTRPWLSDPNHGKIRCPNRGSVRIGDAFYCKVHARQIARKAKIQP
jgi:hypothetical protein